MFSLVPGVTGASRLKMALQAFMPSPLLLKQNMRVPLTVPLKALVWMGTWRSAPKALDSLHLSCMEGICPTFTVTPLRSRAMRQASAILPHWTASVVLP